MLVRFVWPRCTYRGGAWDQSPVDAYFVEATEKEVAESILPRLPRECTEEDRIIGYMHTRMAEIMGNKDNTFCFLVARDLSSMDRFTPHYPIANQWNGYSPFYVMPEVTIASLSELKDLGLPPLPDPLPELA